MHGIYPIYKPKGPTSHDIVDKIRDLTHEKRVGHAGTLDPLASGVLVVAVGREFTKQLELHVQGEKEYVTTIKLGEISSTEDEQGEKRKVPESSFQIPDLEHIQTVLETFMGVIDQVPPRYSAIKIGGTSAFRRLLRGQDIELRSRKIEIKKIELLHYAYPFLKLRVKTGKGVYIRSLARDIGEKLGTGGYVAELERTQVGKFRIENALTVEQFKNSVSERDSRFQISDSSI